MIILTKQLTFIHAADLHLDSPFKGLSEVPETIFPHIRNSTFHAFDSLIKLALEYNVDFVLLVGDLFDNEKQSLRAQVFLRDCFERLNQADIKVYLSYGNHDFLRGNIHAITYPENVYVFDSEQVSAFTYKKNGDPLAQIYGFSYETRAVLSNKAKEFNKKKKEIPFHIGMLHGTLYGNKDHQPYAPFRLSDLRNKRFDYWALGHIHKRKILSDAPPIVYPGNSQGRHRHESGEKGCYLVTLSKSDVDLQFIPLQSILFEQLNVDITNCQSIHDVEPLILKKIKKKKNEQLIYINFNGQAKKLYDWDQTNMFKEMIEIMNESLLQSHPWVYIYRYRIELDNKREIEVDDYFLTEYIQALEEIELEDVIKPLINHRDARKHLDLLKKVDFKKIKERAKQLLVNEFYEGRK